MKTFRNASWFTAVLLCAAAPAAHAQFAVIDVASLTQLVSEVQTLEQQLATARAQLSQAQAQFQAMTGDRGMEQLLAGIVPQLPARGLGHPAGRGRRAPGCSRRSPPPCATRSEPSPVLSAAQLAGLPAAAAAQLLTQRQAAALLQGLTQEALSNSSGRFASLEQLIATIGQAGDQKAALDLQARIAAENAMLQNEGTKLQVLFQAVHAQQQENLQHERELIVAGHGQFAARFAPHP